MASRQLLDLRDGMALKASRFISLAKAAKLDVLIYCTLRSMEEQAVLYRQSRPLSEIKRKAQELSDVHGRADIAKILMGVGPQIGPHVTNAAPGESYHNYGLAFDGCPMVGGKPVWDPEDSLWQIYGDLALAAKLDWAGEWVGFKEFPHCQQTGVNWRELIKTEPIV